MSDVPVWGACDECDNLHVLGSDDHDGETGLCWACSVPEPYIPRCVCDAAQQPCNKAWHLAESENK